MNRLLSLWDDLRSSLWFIPALLVFGAVALAIILIEAESYVAGEQLSDDWPRLFGAGAEGARGMLGAIASSMITVAGVAFSITIVSFALASSQYTSRILRNFMRDRGNQTVLGTLLGIFAYCLVVMRTIRGGDEGAFVPSLAVLVAVLLALVAVGVLVYFIHHIAASIQASSIIQAAAQETTHAVDRLYPADASEPPVPVPAATEPARQDWATVPAHATGYVQSIDEEALVAIACELETVVRMERGVGEFLIEGAPLVALAGKRPDRAYTRKLNAAYTVGRYRTVREDAAYGIGQIVDVALKALSPGMNDPTTAIICIDHLAAVLVRLAPRRVERSHRYEAGQLRVIIRAPTFPSLVAQAFEQIRQNAEGNAAVLTRLLEILATIAAHTREPDRIGALGVQADAIVETVERTILSRHDRLNVQAAAERLSLVMSHSTSAPQV
ncbi:MAG: DUF2254 domain-containing protein [Gemmatimonadales bacterium]